MYSLYILFSQKLNRYYIGSTNDLKRRLCEHNRIKGKFTDTGIPWVVVYTETFDSMSEARKREKFIKSRKSKEFIINLINSR